MVRTTTLTLVALGCIFFIAGIGVYLEQERAFHPSLRRFWHRGVEESTQQQQSSPGSYGINPPRDTVTEDDDDTSAVAPTPEPIVLDLEFDDGVLQKRYYSARMRLVFLVGLEGTGHHYMADVLDKTCKMSSVQCPRVCPLAKVLYPGLSNPESPSAYKDARDGIRKEMQTLASYAEHLPEGATTIASFGVCRFTAGLMSYPNFEGKDKTLQYVDFRVIAEEAERAGVDLRMIYLTRSAKDILISDTQHNSYGGTFMKEARILLTNAAVVESTFLELDSNFTTCFRYEDMSDPTQASRVAEFVAPTAVSAKKLAHTMLATVKHKQPSTGWTLKSYRPAKREDGHHLRYSNGAAMGAWRRGQQPVDLTESAPHRLVVERFQQKLDKIERDQCRRDGMLL